jgi:thiol-disulfide isomerase/thioredoxin
MQRKPVLLALAIFLVLSFWSHPGLAQGKFADLKFAGTISEADRQYLGLEKPGPFGLQDIKAPYVLVEIMRTTCPHCVDQAPALNRLHKLVADSPLKDKVKFIAVGESNHEPALKQFQAAHKIPFALVPDPDWEIGTRFTIQGTPTTVLLDRQGKVLLVEEGVFDNPGAMFKRLKAKVK